MNLSRFDHSADKRPTALGFPDKKALAAATISAWGTVKDSPTDFANMLDDDEKIALWLFFADALHFDASKQSILFGTSMSQACSAAYSIGFPTLQEMVKVFIIDANIDVSDFATDVIKALQLQLE